MAIPVSNTRYYGNVVWSNWRTWFQLDTVTETNTTVTISYNYLDSFGSAIDGDYSYIYQGGRYYELSATGQTKQTYNNPDYASDGKSITLATHTWNKTHSTQTITYSYLVRATNYRYAHWDNPGYTESGPYTDTSSGTATFTIPAKPSYSVSYNANGGSSAPSSQTKWYDETLTLSSSKPTKSGYAFQKWNTNSSGTGTNYNPGASYTTNAALSLYAIWYPVISYDANGGTGAPSNAAKTPGVTYTIPTTTPTRNNYVFWEWNTSSDGTGTSYDPGDSITSDTPLALYAIWKAQPTLSNLSAIRCDSSGNACDDMGYVKVTASYSSEDPITSSSVAVGPWGSASGHTYSAGTGTVEYIVNTAEYISMPNFYSLPTDTLEISLTVYTEYAFYNIGGVLSPSSKYSLPTITNAVVKRTSSSSTSSVDAVGRYLYVSFTSNTYKESLSNTDYGSVSITFMNQSAQTVQRSSATQVVSAHSQQYTYANLTPGSSYASACIISITDKFGYQASVTLNIDDEDYVLPQVSSMRAYRSDASGNADDEGETATIVASWSITQTPSQTAPQSFVISAYDMSDNLIARKALTLSVTSGPTSYTFVSADRQDGQSGDDIFDTEEKYLIRVEVADVYTSDYKADTLSTAYFTMDVLAGGHGVSFGSPAKQEHFNVSMPPFSYEREDAPVYQYATQPAEVDVPIKPCIVVALDTGKVYLYYDNPSA